jgi:hypothetical protein
MYLFQQDLFSGGVLLVLGVAFLAILAVLYFVFRLLKRSVKMAFRLALVAAIAAIMLAGAISLWWFGSGTAEKPKAKPASTRAK